MTIALYDKRAGGCKMQNPTGGIQVRQNVDMIVDDATLYHSNTFDPDPDLLMAQVHRDMSI
eukprot:5060173-Ditylum_brightwellii.AAC.1